jgi:hypothetical protein
VSNILNFLSNFAFLKCKNQQMTKNANTEINSTDFIQLVIPLTLIALVIHFFHIEMDIRLIGIMPLIVFGFTLHAFLPVTLRLPFLFLVNLLAIIRLLGPQEGGILIGIGLFLFALASAPLALRYRAGGLLLAGAALFAFRLEWLPLLGNRTVLPILGSMFMFRMMLYMYEMQFEKEPADIWKKLNYFFLLPNLIFVIFPVVDYTTFIRNYYSRPSLETYRRGILMMGNGVLHFLLYRFIYYYLVPAPDDVVDTFSLLQFMITSYALIVRLAGIFHFSVGVITLFGFYLPHPFEHYFFANNFSDLWRRINIYWRDFVTKVFYFPIYFKLKHLGPSISLFWSVIIVFVINWFLHGYQWFWIRGSFPLTIQDITFWSILGVAVAATSVIQSKRRPKRLNPAVFSIRSAWTHAWSVLGIFMFMSAMWSFWVSYSVDDWWAVVNRGLPSSAAEVYLPILGAFALAGLGVALQYLIFLYQNKRLPLQPSIHRTFLASTLGLAGLLLFGLPAVHKPISERFDLDLEPVLYAKLNKADQMQLFKGYYETLIVSNNLNSRIWELEQAKPDEWKQFHTLGVSNPLPDIREKELKPNISVPFKGAQLTTNSHGMRDREYSLEKPSNTLRIALLGGSIEMGTGVNTNETFENLVEDYLNENPQLLQSGKVEILNFAIAGNHLFQNVGMFEKKALEFQPDVVIYVAHNNEQGRMLRNSIYRTVVNDIDLTYPELKDAVLEAGIKADMPAQEIINRLTPKELELITLGYQKIIHLARKQNVLPIWIYMSTLNDDELDSDAKLFSITKEMGFYVLDISTWQRNENVETLKLAPWDLHPNARGHRLIADAIIQQLKSNTELLEALRGRIPSN